MSKAVRLIYSAIIGVMAVSAASAITITNQIELGGGWNGSTSTQGLTSAYITGDGGSLNSCSPTPCSGSFAEKNYNTGLFSGDTITDVNGNSSDNGATYLPTTANGDQQYTDSNNNIVFAMDADTGDNYWAAPTNSTGTPNSASITIPAGVFGIDNVSEAYILLNNYYGMSGVTSTTVTFNFAGGIKDPVALTNGNQIDSAHDCNPTQSSPTACPSNIGMTTSSSSDIAWSANYAESSSSGTPFASTKGTLDLLDISFNLSAYAGDVLQSITITDNASSSGTLATDTSRLALSAVTVTGTNASFATPEPSTVLLLLAGLGAIGFLRMRSRVRQ
jgi:hypothetical protein